MEGKDPSLVKECEHPSSKVKYSICHSHLGWCGICNLCKKKVHAAYNEFVMAGKKVFRESKWH